MLASRGALLVAFSVVAATALAEDGELDPSFGASGVVITDVDRSDTFSRPSGGRGLALQPDGRIVVGGSDQADFVLFRHLPDGTLDPAFGTGGTVSTDFLGSDADELEDVALQDDGRIVAIGSTYVGPGDLRIALARYEPDGTLDGTFGTAGLVTTPIGVSVEGRAFALQDDGSIVVVAEPFGSTNDLVIARYASDGDLDVSFDGDGVLLLDIDGDPSTDAGPASLDVQSDGKLVVTGWHGAADTGFVARFSDDGSLDPAFGTAGVRLLPGFVPQAVAIQDDERLVVAGSVAGFPPLPALMRLLDDGASDPGFGSAGVVDGTVIGSGVFYDLLLEPGGRIVAAGSRFTFDGDLLLARFEGDGSFDASFSRCGVAVTALDEPGVFFPGDYAFAVARQTDGKLVAAGHSHGRFAVARYGTAPLPACMQAESARGKLVYKAARTSVVWRWVGSPVLPADLGDPLAGTGYRFCVVDAADRPLLQATVPPSFILPSAWAGVKSGFKFGYPITVLPDGVTRILLKAPPTAVGKLKLRMTTDQGFGPSLVSAPFVPPVTARLLRTDSAGCFETVFSVPLKNSEGGFLGRSD